MATRASLCSLPTSFLKLISAQLEQTADQLSCRAFSYITRHDLISSTVSDGSVSQDANRLRSQLDRDVPRICGLDLSQGGVPCPGDPMHRVLGRRSAQCAHTGSDEKSNFLSGKFRVALDQPDHDESVDRSLSIWRRAGPFTLQLHSAAKRRKNHCFIPSTANR